MLIRHSYLLWREEIKPLVIEEYGKDDRVALEESWNMFKDSLKEEGDLTDEQLSDCHELLYYEDEYEDEYYEEDLRRNNMMTIDQAYRIWREDIRPSVIHQYRKADRAAMAESWGAYTDSLFKDGRLTEEQFNECPSFDGHELQYTYELDGNRIINYD